MKNFLALTLVPILSVLSSAAFAQNTWTGTRLKGQPSGLASSGDHSDITGQIASDAVGTARLMVACAIKYDASSARKFLADGDEKSKSGQEFVRNMAQCMSPTSHSASFRFSSRDLRRLVAEALLRTKMPSFVVAVSPTEVVYDTNRLSNDPSDRATEIMSTCVAATFPDQAATLLSTAPNTAEEKKSFSTLIPAFGPCLSDGSKLKADRTFVRLALAEAVYYHAYPPTSSRIEDGQMVDKK